MLYLLTHSKKVLNTDEKGLKVVCLKVRKSSSQQQPRIYRIEVGSDGKPLHLRQTIVLEEK